MGAFFEDVVEHDLIPSQEAVQRNIDTAMLSRQRYLLNKAFAFPKDKVKAAHGEPSFSRQWIPETDRGYLVPMLPPLATDQEKQRFRRTVFPHQYPSVEAANAFFAEHNPPDESEAYAVRVGDTIVITNTHPEKHPSDEVESQSYTRSLTKGPVAAIEGEVGYHQYLIGKQKKNELFLHANNYPGKTTTVSLRPRRERPLTVEIEPEQAVVSEEPSKNSMRITIRHIEGPVRIFVRP